MYCIPGIYNRIAPMASANILTMSFQVIKVSNGAKIRNRYNQVPHLTQDTNGKVTNSQKNNSQKNNSSPASDIGYQWESDKLTEE